MEPVRMDVGRELALLLAGARVVAEEDAVVPSVRERRRPDESARDVEVPQRHVPRRPLRRLPELAAVGGGVADDQLVVAGKEHDVFVQDHAWAGVRLDGEWGLVRLGAPAHLARRAVEADEPLSVMEDSALAVDREGARGDGELLLPDAFARLRAMGEESPGSEVPPPPRVRGARVLPDVARHAPPVGELRGPLPRDEEHDAVRDHDLLREARVVEGEARLARRSVERRGGGVDPERDVDALAHRDQSAEQVRGPALQRIVARVPAVDLALPEDSAVKRVARDEPPLFRQLDRRGRPFVEDVEQAPARGDERRHARHVVVVPRPPGRADPLQPLRRPHDRVLRDGVAVRPVEVVRPLVDVSRTRLHGLPPLSVCLDVGNALGRENAHDLRRRHAAEVLGHYQVHEVLGVGEPLARKHVDRYASVESEGPDALPCHRDLGRRPREAVDDEAIARAERSREIPVATPDVDDEAAGHARRRENISRE